MATFAVLFVSLLFSSSITLNHSHLYLNSGVQPLSYSHSYSPKIQQILTLTLTLTYTRKRTLTLKRTIRLPLPLSNKSTLAVAIFKPLIAHHHHPHYPLSSVINNTNFTSHLHAPTSTRALRSPITFSSDTDLQHDHRTIRVDCRLVLSDACCPFSTLLRTPATNPRFGRARYCTRSLCTNPRGSGERFWTHLSAIINSTGIFVCFVLLQLRNIIWVADFHQVCGRRHD